MKFSIIVPVYNVAPYLRECLDSVLTQTCADWEAVCVDDGSNDGSGAILDEYTSRDARFKVIHQKNAGVSAARNAGLDVAMGGWVVFLDGDDILAPGLLCRLSGLILEGTCDVIRYGYEQFRKKEGLDFKDAKQEPICVNTSNRVAGDLLRCSNLNCGALAFARRLADDLRFQDFICGEDRLFGFELLLRSNSVSLLDETLYGYRIRSGSYVNSPMTLRKLKDEIGYRLEFLRITRKAGKFVEIGDCDWLETYFTHSLLVDVQRIPNGDSDQAWKMWFDCIADCAHFVECSAWTRGLLSVCRRSHSKMASLLLCRYLPAVLLRARRFYGGAR